MGRCKSSWKTQECLSLVTSVPACCCWILSSLLRVAKLFFLAAELAETIKRTLWKLNSVILDSKELIKNKWVFLKYI